MNQSASFASIRLPPSPTGHNRQADQVFPKNRTPIPTIGQTLLCFQNTADAKTECFLYSVVFNYAGERTLICILIHTVDKFNP